MNGLITTFIIIAILLLGIFYYIWIKSNSQKETRAILTDEIELIWLYTITDDENIRELFKQNLYSKYDVQSSVNRQLYHKRLHNMLQYIEEYQDDIETLTKLDPYVKEIEIINNLLKKSGQTSLYHITMLTFKMIEYLVKEEYINALQTRNSLFILISKL